MANETAVAVMRSKGRQGKAESLELSQEKSASDMSPPRAKTNIVHKKKKKG